MKNALLNQEIILSALNSTVNGVVITNHEGKVIYRNDVVEKDFDKASGFTMNEWAEAYEFLDVKTGNKHTLESLPIVKALTERIATKDEEVIVKYNKKDVKHLRVSVSPIIENNNLLGSVVTYEDVTEFKKQQAELASVIYDKELLFTAMESTSDIVVVTDYYGNIKYINNATRKAFKVEIKDVTTLHAKDYHAPESWEYLTKKMIPKAMKKGATQGDITFVKANGELIQVSQVLVCKKDKNDRVEFFASISRDISDIKTKEEEIKKQQAYLLSIIEANPNLIFVKDEKGRYKLANKKFAKAASTTIKDIIGKNDFEINVPKEHAQKYQQQDDEIRATGKPVVDEQYYIDSKSHEEVWLQTVKTILKAPDGKTEILGVATDITNIKKIESSLKKQLHFSELIATISTEFFNISYKEIDDLMLYALKIICDNTPMTGAVIGEINKHGKVIYKHALSTDGNDPYKGEYVLAKYNETDFQWILTKIEKNGFVFLSEMAELSDAPSEISLLKEIGIKSFFIIPLQNKTKKLGYLILTSKHETQLPESDTIFIRTLSRILSNAVERANTERFIDFKLRFEEIITALSSKFINIEPAAIDAEISEALKIVGNFFETDQGYVFSFNKNDNTLNLIHSWLADGRPIDAGSYWGLPYNDFPWAFDIIQNNGFISIPDLNSLPEEAAYLKEVMSAGGIKSMFGVPIFFHKEFIGAYIFASFTKEKFWFDGAESLLKILGQVFANALERKRNDEKLRESERLYRTIAANIPKVGVVVFDRDLRIKIVEGRNFRDYEIRTDLMEGRTFDELRQLPYMPYDYSEYDEYNEYYRRVLQGEEITIEKTYLTFHYKIYICPVKNSKNEITAGILIAFDVTDFKEIENKLQNQAFELQRSNEDLEQFAYAASHDLQEPLRMVSSYVHLIERKIGESLSDDVKEFMFYAIDGVKRMQELINDILEYSRVERKGKAFAKIELNHVITAVKFNLQKTISENDVTLICPSLPAIKGDYSQITSLFQNLTDNAIKFRSDKKPVVEIGFSEQKNKYTFFVKDNGVGIEKKYYDRIFVIFQRLNNRTEYPGTGIGLAICKKIVERHGGKIWVESEPNQGTTFYFELKK